MLDSERCDEIKNVSEDDEPRINVSELETNKNRKSVFQAKARHSDLVLKIENEDVHVSRAVLSIASPVFSAMFESEFQEKSQDQIDLPGKKYDEFVEFLECIYPNMLNAVTDDNVYKVVHLADEYQVDILKDKCHEFLINKMDENTSTEELLRHLHIAEKYRLSQLENRCICLTSELTVTEMKTWTDAYPVSFESQNKMKELGLKRYELEKKDNQLITDKVKTLEGYSQSIRELICSMLKVDIVSNKTAKQQQVTPSVMFEIMRQAAFRQAPPRGYGQPTSYGRPTRTAFGQPTGFGQVPLNFSSTTLANPTSTLPESGLQGIRKTYKHFPNDNMLKTEAVGIIRRLMKTFTADEQDEFELLPEDVKHEIRGKNVWAILSYPDKVL